MKRGAPGGTERAISPLTAEPLNWNAVEIRVEQGAESRTPSFFFFFFFYTQEDISAWSCYCFLYLDLNRWIVDELSLEMQERIENDRWWDGL